MTLGARGGASLGRNLKDSLPLDYVTSPNLTVIPGGRLPMARFGNDRGTERPPPGTKPPRFHGDRIRNPTLGRGPGPMATRERADAVVPPHPVYLAGELATSHPRSGLQGATCEGGG